MEAIKVNMKKNKRLRIQVEFIKAFIIAIVVITIVCPVATTAYFQDIFEISVDGKVIGYALSKEEVGEAYKAARLDRSKENDGLIIVEMPLEVNKVKGNKLKASKGEDLVSVICDKFEDLESNKVLAYTIKVNNYTATLSSKEDILSVLEKTQEGYDEDNAFTVEYVDYTDREVCVLGVEVTGASTESADVAMLSTVPDSSETEGTTEASGEGTSTEATMEEGTPEDSTEPESPSAAGDGILNIDFQEDIQVIETYVNPDNISDVDTVLADLTTARKEIDKYEVKPGDCLSVIAENHEMSMDDLVVANEGLDVDSNILIGDELNVMVPKTEVSVLVDKQETYDETYRADTKYVDDDSMYVGEETVTQEASEGQRTVTAIVSYNNGSEYNREIINQVVTVEAQPKIVHRGTKTIPTYICPLSNPRITSNFGKRTSPKAGASTNHKGIDYGTPTGTAVFSTRGGTVVSAGWLGGYGYCVIIYHGDGVQSRYGHLSKPLVSAGETVKQGQKIALSGNTGNSTGPHLHFEIRINGEAVNPNSLFD